MSIPPQLIRVKRKRGDEDTPVTFLQFEDGVKRHRTGNNWVYQHRRLATSSSTPTPASVNDAKPVIHISRPDDDGVPKPETKPTTALPKLKALSPRPSLQRLRSEPRRFHLSRAMMAAANNAQSSGTNKRARGTPAVFVERSRKKMALRKGVDASTRTSAAGNESELAPMAAEGEEMEQESDSIRVYKKPTARARSPQPDTPSRAPLPASASQPHSDDLDKRAADMNQWVLNEIGANLQEMEHEKQLLAAKAKFRPKPPAKRYKERHPEEAAALQPASAVDTPMGETSDVDGMEEDGDDDDWVIDEYVRIPAHSMAVNVSPMEVGVLVLEGEEDDNLFFGPEHDDDDDMIDDDEDENAENHYTADYPEDEVDSDDEFGRNPYHYRNMNASDEEEFDNELDSDDNDEMILEGNDDDMTMARIKNYMQRKPNMSIRNRP